MTTQLLIYESVVPLSVHRHGKGAVEAGSGYAFSGKTNSVPLMAVEFSFAASEYPIVFAGTKESFTPAVILGVRESQNLYLTQDAKWEAKYIPAFVRRYPFVFTKSEDEKRLVLCIDEAYEGFNQEGRGNRLFGEDDKPTEYVQNILKFLQEYQAQFERTQAFCARIRELDLLEPMQAQVEMPCVSSTEISVMRQSRSAADSSDARRVDLVSLAAGLILPLPKVLGATWTAAADECMAGAGVQRSGASRSSSPAMPTSVNRA
jgi:SapC